MVQTINKTFSLNLYIKHYPVSILMRATIGPPAKRHLNGVSSAGRWWPEINCWLGNSCDKFRLMGWPICFLNSLIPLHVFFNTLKKASPSQ